MGTDLGQIFRAGLGQTGQLTTAVLEMDVPELPDIQIYREELEAMHRER